MGRGTTSTKMRQKNSRRAKAARTKRHIEAAKEQARTEKGR